MSPPAGSPTGNPQEQNERGILASLHALARSGADGLRTSQQWEAWLHRAGRFTRFGFTNTMLIWAQNPDAVLLHDYREWQRFGRQVVQGERGIRLITADRKSHQERVGILFDLLQTEGKPMLFRPTEPTKGRTPGPGTWEALASLALRAGFRVTRDGKGTSIDWQDRIVHVRRGDDELIVLTHQIGHVLMHQGPVDCQGITKVEADSVAFLITRRLGLDVSGISFPYVTSWAGTDERAQAAEIVTATGQRIMAAAAKAFACIDTNAGSPSRLVLGPRLAKAKQPGRPAVPTGRTAPPAPSAGQDRDDLVRIQQAALEFFTERTSQSWVPGYLSGRGFPPVIQQRWSAGYAPDEWTALTDTLRAQGYSDKIIEASGLAKRSSRGTLIDTFRNRAVFPVRSPDGVVLGFIGRAHPEAGPDVPKYLNSPDTALYHKGRVLFGLWEGREVLRSGGTPVVVEGLLDVMAINFATGDRYAGVTPCGTALTADQAALLGQVSDPELGVLAAFDGDQAGRQAAIRAYEPLRRVTGRLFAVQFPDEQDPAGYFRQHGADALVQVLDTKTRSIADLVVDARVTKFDRHLEFIEGKFNALHAVAPLIAELPTGDVARQVARVAERLGLTPAEVTEAVTAAVHERARVAPRPHAPPQALKDSPEPASTTDLMGVPSPRNGSAQTDRTSRAQHTRVSKLKF